MSSGFSRRKFLIALADAMVVGIHLPLLAQARIAFRIRKGSSVAGGAQFVAGAQNGAIAVSADGISWTVVTTNNPFYTGGASITGIAKGGSIYVAVGGSILCTSADGRVWTQQANPTGTTLNGVAFNDPYFVVIGSGRTAYRSTDGINWSSVSSGAGSGLPGSGNGGATNFNAISAGGGRFFMAGSNATNDQNFAATSYSSDGSSWTAVGPPYTGAQSPYGSGGSTAGIVALGNNVVVSAVMHTADGSYYGMWYVSTNNGTSYGSASTGLSYGWQLKGASSGSVKMISTTGGTSISSDNGANWSTVSPGVGGGYGLAFGANLFVMIDGSGNCATSANGSSWTARGAVFSGTGANFLMYG